jgi:hypothetical protein
VSDKEEFKFFAFQISSPGDRTGDGNWRKNILKNHLSRYIEHCDVLKAALLGHNAHMYHTL